MNANDYTRRLLAAWHRLRDAPPGRSSARYDRAVAQRLWTEATPLETAIAAIHLANSRLAARPPNLPPLPPPRSLAYILPILDELRRAHPTYIAYLLGERPHSSASE